jgi:RHH-type transcriptional regulator, proline utilization regulon repressor / proline dehydrogenase / delta 1-pyrroline-5-carboxylate dehydrogenase
MPVQMSEPTPTDSTYLKNARQQLETVKGRSLPPEQRQKSAIDLAADMLMHSRKIQTHKEKRLQAELARMMQDPRGKAFTTSMTDQCFRSQRSSRVANQLIYLLNQFGIPVYLSFSKQLQLRAFRMLGDVLSFIFVPLAAFMLRKQTSKVILPGETGPLSKHMALRRQQGIKINLNHLGEAILGEEEAKRRLNVYLEDLVRPDIEYISIKISTIFSQINLLAWNDTLETLARRLRRLYQAAMSHRFIRADGTSVPKFVNLDMEEYRDLLLTKELFKKVLNEKEFFQFSAGIVLQAYLPDAHPIQKELTEWAKERIRNGGAPIKIRIVKGANLAMEQVEASIKGWAQAPYPNKTEVDANFKMMVAYGCIPENAKAVHLGIGSHNLFDIAYAMLLRAENNVDIEVNFEMLEGMADPIRRVVQSLVHEMLLYCPAATREDFESAIAYLIRRLDENTGPENFLRHVFGLKPNTRQWEEQAALFTNACAEIGNISFSPRRTQSRLGPPQHLSPELSFENEADTDFSLTENRKWAEGIIDKWHQKNFEPIPLVINGRERQQKEPEGCGISPSHPGQPSYYYSMADWGQIDEALNAAKTSEASWCSKTPFEHAHLLLTAAHKMREKREDLIGVMMADGGKTILEADPEVSEAIDFAEYYRRSILKMHACKDIHWKPKGTILVAPPWNFPISIPAGGILAALAAGNCVLFKPAPEAVLSGWVLVNILWQAGIPKEVLQFINCPDEPVGTRLIADPRLDSVILTGATSTAKHFLRSRPGLDLAAETGGKNAMIITGMSDRDLAIKDLIQSAFGHSGQKCSAASLAILEAEVYDDSHFMKQLKDAVESLAVGLPWDLSSKVIPLIRQSSETLLKGLISLDKGEKWLVQPKQDPHNSNLWSPGVKLGVKEGSFMHQTELFGPVLGVMRAKDLDHAIKLANGTSYGLTSGIHTLDEREYKKWLNEIEAGNCYINRGITGAIVRRQPFGGCKASSFGQGAKAGGPNYVAQCALPKQVGLPREKSPVSGPVNNLTTFIEKIDLNAEQLGLWYASIANYAYWIKRFHHDHDPTKVVGQDNILRYKKRSGIYFRIQEHDAPMDVLRVCAAALTCSLEMHISWARGKTVLHIDEHWRHAMPKFRFVEESEERFNERVKKGAYTRIRLLSNPSDPLQNAAAASVCCLTHAPVLANGRFELLHYLREVSISLDYHRYGNLGIREGELRKEIL